MRAWPDKMADGSAPDAVKEFQRVAMGARGQKNEGTLRVSLKRMQAARIRAASSGP